MIVFFCIRIMKMGRQFYIGSWDDRVSVADKPITLKLSIRLLEPRFLSRSFTIARTDTREEYRMMIRKEEKLCGWDISSDMIFPEVLKLLEKRELILFEKRIWGKAEGGERGHRKENKNY